MTVSKVSQSRNGHNWYAILRCTKALLAMLLPTFLAGDTSPRGDSTLDNATHPGIGLRLVEESCHQEAQIFKPLYFVWVELKPIALHPDLYSLQALRQDIYCIIQAVWGL